MAQILQFYLFFCCITTELRISKILQEDLRINKQSVVEINSQGAHSCAEIVHKHNICDFYPKTY